MNNDTNVDVVDDILDELDGFDWDEIKKELEAEADLEDMNNVRLEH